MKNTVNMYAIPSFKKMVDDFFNTSLGDLIEYNETSFRPDANIKEEDEAYRIELSVPGFSKKDIKMEIENGLLKISAEKEESEEDKKKKYFIKEFKARSFRRQFQLPDSVLVDNISAEYSNGILSVKIPKDMESKENVKFQVKIK